MRKYTGFCQTTTKIAGGFCYLVSSKKNSFQIYRRLFGTNSFPGNNAVGVCETIERCFILYEDLFYHHRRFDKNLTLTSSSAKKTFFSASFKSVFGGRRDGGPLLSAKKLFSSNLLKIHKRYYSDWILTSSSRVPEDNISLIHQKIDEEMEYFEKNSEKPMFKPKKIVILTKLTRLEFERRTNPDLTEEELAKSLKLRGSDYKTLLEKYRTHISYLNTICKELESKGIEFRLLQRWDYTEENIEWADAIFTAGGDGTFLLAASKVRDRNKPVIGINTDPTGSEGYMCLMKKTACTESKFPSALERLLNGDFSWLWRQRIRVTLSGKYAFDDPIELHDQQLMYPEYRWTEHVRENEDVRLRSKSRLKAKNSIGTPDSSSPVVPSPLMDGLVANGPRRILPYLALNEVFIGESLSSRVSYYELQVDENERIKQKSSGLSVCTGTGSTSWYFNINKLTDRCVRDLMQIMSEELDVNLPVEDQTVISRLCKRFNEQLIFSPSDLRLAYTVRDPVFNATFPPCPPRGFAQKVLIKSRCFDAHLVIDGGMSYIFNDGTQAVLEMQPEDALRTVIFR